MQYALNSEFGLAASVIQYKAWLTDRLPEKVIDHRRKR
jgi:hypothetical protein